MRPTSLLLTLVFGSTLAAPVTARAQDVFDFVPIALSQQGAAFSTPNIVVSGQGQVTLPADHAVLRFAVQTMGATGAEASTQATQRIAAVTDTLRRRGFHSDSVQVGNLSVGPSGEAPMTIRRPNEYSARAEVRVTLRKLDQLAQTVDAVLAAGASSLTGVQYGSDRTEAARGQALRDAFQKARASAETLAEAAGRKLGEILSMSTTANPYDYYGQAAMMSEMYVSSGAPMRSVPRDVVVRVAVQVVWRLN